MHGHAQHSVVGVGRGVGQGAAARGSASGAARTSLQIHQVNHHCPPFIARSIGDHFVDRTEPDSLGKIALARTSSQVPGVLR